MFGFSFIESKIKIRYLMYRYKIINTKDKEFLIETSNLRKSHKIMFRRGWYKNVNSWLNHWRIEGPNNSTKY